MNKHVVTYYKRFRASGMQANHALRSARTLDRFEDLAEEGKVKLTAEPEEENYFDVYGEPDTKKERAQIESAIDLWGNWCVCSYVKTCEKCGTWELVDSVGMCAGYHNPTNPCENWYVPDLMAAAIDAVDKAETEVVTC